jgi:hypothetical protein
MHQEKASAPSSMQPEMLVERALRDVAVQGSLVELQGLGYPVVTFTVMGPGVSLKAHGGSSVLHEVAMTGNYHTALAALMRKARGRLE